MTAPLYSSSQEVQLRRLGELFLEKNQQLNLSAIRTEAEAWDKHIVDSLLVREFIDFREKIVLDLGTGGGFPLLPLAICEPKTQFWGLDARAKKTKAVAEIARDLGLKNVQLQHGRAEEFAQKWRENFDLITVRAVGPPTRVLPWGWPLLKRGGAMVLYGGPQLEELRPQAEKWLDSHAGKWEHFAKIPCDYGLRTIAVIRKQG